MIDISALSLPLLLGLTLLLLCSVAAAMRRVGQRLARRGADEPAALEAALLGVLGLMIGFTFSMALNRFEARRDAVTIEANAIGTTALRARMLAEPERSASLALLKAYANLRIPGSDGSFQGRDLDTVLARSNEIQEQLWQLAMQATARDKTVVPNGMYVASLNEMIDDQAKRLSAVRNRVPQIVTLTLYTISVLSAGLIGLCSGFHSRQRGVTMLLMTSVIGILLVLIQDLDRPGQGFIKVSQQPMIETAASIAGY